MAQFARPDSDVSTGTWTATPLWSKLDETVADDTTTQIDSGDVLDVENAFQVGLSDVTDPNSSSGHILRVRHDRATNQIVDITDTVTITVRLKQGGTTIASTTNSGSNNYATLTLTLSAAEANAITNYADLRAEVAVIRGQELDGRQQIRITWIEFEVPDVSAAATVRKLGLLGVG